MKYIKELKEQDFSKALSLDKNQVDRLTVVIQQAYDQNWHHDGPNIDQINAFVAPHIFTPEEAFFVATVVLTDVMGALGMHKLMKA